MPSDFIAGSSGIFLPKAFRSWAGDVNRKTDPEKGCQVKLPVDCATMSK